MRYLFVTVALLLVIGLAADAQTGKEPKGKLPTGWSKLLKLTPAQSAQLREIDRKMQLKVRDLQEQIRQLRVSARQDMLKVLSAEQRKTLAESVLGKDLETPRKKEKE
jgi:Spy/CpxP family protein refolding chaperone